MTATVLRFGCILEEYLNNEIKRHERCLRLIYNDKDTTFRELLKKDCFVSILIRNFVISCHGNA